MDMQIALLLGQDGLTNGAIYALLALALVLVFAVTRVIFIPQGEFVAFGALTLVSLQAGKLPGTLWLLLALGTLIALIDGVLALRNHQFRRVLWIVSVYCVLPLLLAGALFAIPAATLPLPVQVGLALMLVVPLGPMIYRLAYQPIAGASVLVLLIVSVAVHVTMMGIGLLFFGAEGSRTLPFSDVSFSFGDALLQGQAILVVVTSMLLIMALYFFFELADGSRLRAGYADQNGHPFRGVGRLLVERGELKLEEASMQGIKGWIARNPDRATALLNENASYVFFREIDAKPAGPLGSLGVPLTAERSIAVDPRFIPLGSVVWLATTYPNALAPLQRLMFAQDTGGAIRGVVRADFYWGTGHKAGEQAGRMRQNAQMWVLWPKGTVPPAPQ